MVQTWQPALGNVKTTVSKVNIMIENKTSDKSIWAWERWKLGFSAERWRSFALACAQSWSSAVSYRLCGPPTDVFVVVGCVLSGPSGSVLTLPPLFPLNEMHAKPTITAPEVSSFDSEHLNSGECDSGECFTAKEPPCCGSSCSSTKPASDFNQPLSCN